MLRKFGIHLTLLAGCAVFSFPFLWLIGTSAKADTEIFVFPPKWIPRIPTYSIQSPFISANAYDSTRVPAQLSASEWNHIWPRIRESLWNAALKSLGQDWNAEVSRWPGYEDNCRRQMTRGLWEQVQGLVPDRVWRAPDELPEFAAKALTKEFVDSVWKRVRRVFALGEFNIRNRKNDAIQFDGTSWKTESSHALKIARGRIAGTRDGDILSLITYDLTDAPTVRLTRTLHLPISRDQISGISLPIQTDETWHRLDVTLENAGSVFRSRRPIFLDLWTMQEANWDFRQPTDRNSRTIVWDPVPNATTEIHDPNTYRFTIDLASASRLRAVWEKYTNNYRWAVRYVPFGRLLANSMFLVLLNVVGQVLACSLVAYAFARLHWFGRNALFGLLLATMMVPGQVTEIPRFILMKWFGWYDTLTPLWIGSWFGAAFFIFLLRQFFMTIPKELEDAAKIDGCNHFGIWWRVMLPLVKPALATVAIFQFMASWNDFMGPLIYLSDERHYPLSYGLYMFRTEHGGEWGMLMAASTIMVMPVIGIFFLCQRYFIQGVTLTGMKQ